jgi:hypothetical protein
MNPLSYRRGSSVLTVLLLALASFALLFAIGTSAAAQNEQASKPTPDASVESPEADQLIVGYPLTITVKDTTQLDIRYRDPDEYQFYGRDAEGVYLWVNVGGVTRVYGPETVPAGNAVYEYTPVSNLMTGSGTPADPWVVTTVVLVPDTSLRLTQRTTYVNGAEFVNLNFELSQVAGTGPITATLFHAADLYTAGSDSGFGFYDPETGGVGSYYTRTNGSVLYQQFVPTSPASAYMESYYSTIWDAIGDTSGPGPGFDNTIISDTLHDAGAGLQWNLTVPQTGSVAVGSTDLFSPHASLCGSFSDVPEGSYFYEPVYYLACNGIVNGYSDTTFRPYNPAIRGQLTKIVTLAEGWPFYTPATPTFSDVPPSNPFYVFIETAHNRGIIQGYLDGTFRWQNNVTRGQAMKIIVGSRGWPIYTPATPTFSDVPPTNPFYQWIETAYNRGIIQGYTDGTFRWQNDITRGQLSKVEHLALTGAH